MSMSLSVIVLYKHVMYIFLFKKIYLSIYLSICKIVYFTVYKVIIYFSLCVCVCVILFKVCRAAGIMGTGTFTSTLYLSSSPCVLLVFVSQSSQSRSSAFWKKAVTSLYSCLPRGFSYYSCMLVQF